MSICKHGIDLEDYPCTQCTEENCFSCGSSMWEGQHGDCEFLTDVKDGREGTPPPF